LFLPGFSHDAEAIPRGYEHGSVEAPCERRGKGKRGLFEGNVKNTDKANVIAGEAARNNIVQDGLSKRADRYAARYNSSQRSLQA
jgi:hypothetical protein